MHELLGELRAEVTRLKAEQAKERAQNWIQRYPLLAVTLSVGVGAAAGYGTSMALHPRPPRSLSEHARQRLRELTGDARKVATRFRQQLGERAAQSGEQLRKRAEETGRRLAEEAQHAGESARREAKEAAGRASVQARKFGEETSERLREATDEAKQRVQERQKEAVEEALELGETLGEQASEALDEYTDSMAETSKNEGRSFTRGLLAVAGIAAGGYLASKARHWL
jgi:gas vesicle protein